jgi:hypothetical protein
MHTVFWLKNLNGRRNPLEGLGVDEKIILEWILGKRWEGVDWMHLTQVGDKWQALVNTVINTRVP